MSKTNKIFDSIPVQIPDRSGFDLSHEVLTTAKTGTIIPITHFEVLPGDTISMGSMMKVTLPPFAVPFMGRVDAALEAFFVPNRLLWQGWQSFITQNNGTNTPGNTGSGHVLTNGVNGLNSVPAMVPTVLPFSASAISRPSSYRLVGPGSLSNYLGVKFAQPGVVNNQLRVNAMPYLAYQKVCDDWYRDENNMKPFFPKVNPYYQNVSQGAPSSGLVSMSQLLPTGHLSPFVPVSTSSIESNAGLVPNPVFEIDGGYSDFIANGLTGENAPFATFDPTIMLGSLRQRCWSKDYFTTATTRPQAGADSQVMFDTSGDTGGFTVASLRSANALQKWLERNSISGTEYGSQILAHFGVTPPDAVLNRSVLLGQVRTPVVVSSVENSAGIGTDGASGTKSPYGNVLGAAAGFGSSFDKGNLVDNFTVKEHGYIMVMFTLIPHAYYNSGIPRELLHYKVGDYAWPEFAGIGDQPIYASELAYGNLGSNWLNTWGYQQRFAEYKHKLDSITGLLSDGHSLDAYALQRGFINVPDLGKEFLTIPTDYLDQVLGVSADVAGFGCMVDAYFDCQALRVLPEYSLPHL